MSDISQVVKTQIEIDSNFSLDAVAEDIKFRLKRMATDVWQIGDNLCLVKQYYLLNEDEGVANRKLLDWAITQTGLSESSVKNFLNVRASFTLEQVEKLEISGTGLSALYRLSSADSEVKPRVIQEALDLVKEGDKITPGMAKDLVSGYKDFDSDWSKDSDNTDNENEESEPKQLGLPFPQTTQSKSKPQLAQPNEWENKRQQLESFYSKWKARYGPDTVRGKVVADLLKELESLLED